MVELHKGFGGAERLGPGDKNENNSKKEELSFSESSGTVMGKGEADLAGAQDFYNDLVAYAKGVMDLASQGKENEIDVSEMLVRAEKLADRFMNEMDLRDLVYLAHKNNEYKENYIYTHSVNVCLLSSYIAISLHYSRARVVEIIIATLFHDIGMFKLPVQVWNNDGALSQEEYKAVHDHPEFGAAIFENLEGIPEAVPTIIRQHHEKIDGTGYPKGLKKEEINYLGRLVGIINRYEAQTHTRLWRKRSLPDVAIQEILDEDGTGYDPHFLKAILRHISIFPVGSWVKISSGEVGNVLKVNEDTPMRPVVNVVFSRDKRRLDEPRVLDLSKQLLIHVENCVSEDSIEGL